MRRCASTGESDYQPTYLPTTVDIYHLLLKEKIMEKVITQRPTIVEIYHLLPQGKITEKVIAYLLPVVDTLYRLLFKGRINLTLVPSCFSPLTDYGLEADKTVPHAEEFINTAAIAPDSGIKRCEARMIVAHHCTLRRLHLPVPRVA